DDSATISIGAGSAPYQGTFRPETALGALIGRSGRGTWQLVIEDRAVSNRGRLNLVTLNIEGTSGSGAASLVEHGAESFAIARAESVGNEGAALSALLQRDEQNEPVRPSAPRKVEDSLANWLPESVTTEQPAESSGLSRSQSIESPENPESLEV